MTERYPPGGHTAPVVRATVERALAYALRDLLVTTSKRPVWAK